MTSTLKLTEHENLTYSIKRSGRSGTTRVKCLKNDTTGDLCRFKGTFKCRASCWPPTTKSYRNGP